MSRCTPTNSSGASGPSGVARLRTGYLASKLNISASALACTRSSKPAGWEIDVRELAPHVICSFMTSSMDSPRRLTGACSRRILDNLRVLFRMGKGSDPNAAAPRPERRSRRLEAAFAMLGEEAAQENDNRGAELLP
ncbi:MAG: hypothetical protein ACLSAH_07555 [Bilophila wadsworthia]